MKKLLFLLLVPLLLAGCGAANQVVCSSQQEIETGVNTTTSLIAELKNDKVESVKAEVKFEDKDVAKQYCDLYQLMNSFAENEEDKINISCSDDTMTLDASVLDEATKDAIGLTKEEFISQMEQQDGVSCK